MLPAKSEEQRVKNQRRLTMLVPNYGPETGAASRRLVSAAEHFRNAGWRVTVIAPAPHHPENRVWQGFDGWWRRSTIENGIKVIRFAPILVPPTNLLLRLVSELLFSLKAAVQAMFTRPDVVLASSPYMFLGPAGLLTARLSRSRFAWDVRDMTWKYARATGRRTFGADRLLASLMSLTAKRADTLTTATDGQLEELGPLNSGNKAVITNGLTDELLEALAAGEPTLADGRFMVAYAGLLGLPQGLGTLIEAAALFPEARFVIAGSGPEREQLEVKALKLGLDNVEFLGYLGLEQLQQLYASADVLVALLRGSEEFKVAQPSKVWEYMASGRPVLFAGECETTNIMVEEDIGVVVPPEDPESLGAVLHQLANDPLRRSRLGQRGREFVRVERNRNEILDRWESLLRT